MELVDIPEADVPLQSLGLTDNANVAAYDLEILDELFDGVARLEAAAIEDEVQLLDDQILERAVREMREEQLMTPERGSSLVERREIDLRARDLRNEVL